MFFRRVMEIIWQLVTVFFGKMGGGFCSEKVKCSRIHFWGVCGNTDIKRRSNCASCGAKLAGCDFGGEVGVLLIEFWIELLLRIG